MTKEESKTSKMDSNLIKGNWENNGKYAIPHDEGVEFVVGDSNLKNATYKTLMCNQCKYYEGVHNVQGHAPCSYWKSGGVLWNWYCSQGTADTEAQNE